MIAGRDNDGFFKVLCPETLVNEVGSHLETGTMPTIVPCQTNCTGCHRIIDNYSNYPHRGEGGHTLWWKLRVMVFVRFRIFTTLRFSPFIRRTGVQIGVEDEVQDAFIPSVEQTRCFAGLDNLP